MPLFKSDEDLFRESTMTFGEHLEDLRSCLFRAIAGLMVGFILGLIFGISRGPPIQTPLHRALTEYYQRKPRRRRRAICRRGEVGQGERGYGQRVQGVPRKEQSPGGRRSTSIRPPSAHAIVRPKAPTGPGDQAVLRNESDRLDQDLALPGERPKTIALSRSAWDTRRGSPPTLRSSLIFRGRDLRALGLLSALVLRGVRPLSARAVLRSRLPALQRAVVPGRGLAGLLLRLSSPCCGSC